MTSWGSKITRYEITNSFKFLNAGNAWKCLILKQISFSLSLDFDKIFGCCTHKMLDSVEYSKCLVGPMENMTTINIKIYDNISVSQNEHNCVRSFWNDVKCPNRIRTLIVVSIGLIDIITIEQRSQPFE